MPRPLPPYPSPTAAWSGRGISRPWIAHTHTLTLAADHTFAFSAWSGGERFVEARGTWRLIGHDLIRHVTWSIAERLQITERGVKMPPRYIRETIVGVTHDTLAFRSGITYKRGKAPPRPTI